MVRHPREYRAAVIAEFLAKGLTDADAEGFLAEVQPVIDAEIERQWDSLPSIVEGDPTMSHIRELDLSRADGRIQVRVYGVGAADGTIDLVDFDLENLTL